MQSACWRVQGHSYKAVTEPRPAKHERHFAKHVRTFDNRFRRRRRDWFPWMHRHLERDVFRVLGVHHWFMHRVDMEIADARAKGKL